MSTPIVLGDTVSSPGAINVKSYGAVGNGTADDATAIQATIDAANALGGRVVLLPQGTYRVVAGVVLKSGVTLRGEGRGVTIIHGDPTGTLAGVVRGTSITDFGVEHLTISGTIATDGVELLDFVTSTDGRIHDVGLDTGTYLGLFFNTCSRIEVNGLWVSDIIQKSTGVGGTGVHIFHGNTDIVLSNIFVDTVEGEGLWLDAGTTGGGGVANTNCVLSNINVKNFGAGRVTH